MDDATMALHTHSAAEVVYASQIKAYKKHKGRSTDNPYSSFIQNL